MNYAIQQHRAVIQRLSDMYSEEMPSGDSERPLTARARDAALYMFSRRPDITIGVYLQRTHQGGLRFDILRAQSDYVFEISDIGSISLITSNAAKDATNGSLFADSVHEDFFHRLDKILPDPLSEVGKYDFPPSLPRSGVYSGQTALSSGAVLKFIRTSNDLYASCAFHSHLFGFDRIAIPLPPKIKRDGDGILRYMIDMAERGARDIAVSRDTGLGIVNLHPIEMFRSSLSRRLKFNCGYDLFWYQQRWLEVNRPEQVGSTCV